MRLVKKNSVGIFRVLHIQDPEDQNKNNQRTCNIYKYRREIKSTIEVFIDTRKRKAHEGILGSLTCFHRKVEGSY